jgi:ABC-type Fe3+/spermidine/putrescine transport system ATPase subunit
MGRAGEGIGEEAPHNTLTSTMAALSLRNVSKTFGSVNAVSEISLEIRSGEFFSILGPSGCGKTTLLRMIAGFEQVSSGTISLDGRNITSLPAQARGIGMVFQNYALFPHMTVFNNVAFGLETRKLETSVIRKRVEAILDAVRLRDKTNVPVPLLSGGEQQRVAVARALVVEPALLLFDEPLSNLDVALRIQTREEIRSLQRKTGITTVYVTHDQAEAMSLSDRVAVMRAGRFEQVGTPVEIYESPVSPFVAGFVGGGNLVTGIVREGGVFETNGATMVLPATLAGSVRGRAVLAIKPEAVALVPNGDSDGLSGTIEDREYLGFTTNFVANVSGVRLHVAALSSPETDRLKPGARAQIRIDWSRCMLYREG